MIGYLFSLHPINTMKKHSALRFRELVCSLLVTALLAQSIGVTLAANNPNSSITDGRILNLTANVDWDYDTQTPLQAGTGNGTDQPSVLLTKDALKNQVFRELARSIYLMTEGRHRIGTIYVFKNSRFGKNVDIQIINKIDRSNANVAYWQVSGGTSSNYLAMMADQVDADGNPIKDANGKTMQTVVPTSLSALGTIIAHEMGHYIYGLMDEYIEVGAALDAAEPGSPSETDKARSTIMQDSAVFTRLSVAADYPKGLGKDNNQTAQARVYASDAGNLTGGSHWEVLTRDPAHDSAAAIKEHRGDRTFFAAFKDYKAPTSLAELSKFFGVHCPLGSTSTACRDETFTNPGSQGTPAQYRIEDASVYNSKKHEKSGGTCNAGYCVDATDGQIGSAFENFKVEFVGSSNAINRDVLMIDRTMPQAQFDEVIKAAITQVQSPFDASHHLGIVVSPTNGSTPLAAIQALDSEANKTNLINALKSLKRSDGVFDMASAYNQARSMIAAGRSAADPSTITLMTSFTTGTIPGDQGSKARADRTAIDVQYLPTSGSQATGPLLKLAKDSGGDSYSIRNAQQAAKAMKQQSRIDDGHRISLLGMDDFEPGKANGRDALAAKVSPYDKTIIAEWYFDPADKGLVRFSLQPPLGAAITVLHKDSDLDAGYARIESSNADGSLTGEWKAEVHYTGKMSDTVEATISADSEVELIASMSGGERSEQRPPFLRVLFSGNSPITHANVVADVFRAEDGEQVLSDILLKDDGSGADARENDGSYTVDLSGKLPAGDYVIIVRAESTEHSMFEPNQRFARGSAVAATPVGAGLERVDFLSISLESGAPGILPPASASASSASGGCTVAHNQNDAGLLILLFIAGLGLSLRRWRRP